MPPKAPAGKVAKKPGTKPGAKKATPGKAQVTASEKKDPRFEKRPKNFGIGNDLPPPRDMKRFVRWPRYVWRQRRVRILQNRLKVPSAINQFAHTIDTHTRQELVKLCQKYKPESAQAKRARHKATAAAKVAGRTKRSTIVIPQKPMTLRCGVKCVTRLVERNRAKLVLIAHDVNPIEIVLFLPALCKKMQIPYCIVKGKALLGQLVGFKTASCVAFEKIRPEDKPTLDKLIESVTVAFNDKYDELKKEHGGLKIGRKAEDKRRLRERRAERGHTQA